MMLTVWKNIFGNSIVFLASQFSCANPQRTQWDPQN